MIEFEIKDKLPKIELRENTFLKLIIQHSLIGSKNKVKPEVQLLNINDP